MTDNHSVLRLPDRSDDAVSLRDIPAPQVYTVRQVAGLLGLNLGTTYDLIRKGEIPAKRLGRRWLVPRESFHAWLLDMASAS